LGQDDRSRAAGDGNDYIIITILYARVKPGSFDKLEVVTFMPERKDILQDQIHCGGDADLTVLFWIGNTFLDTEIRRDCHH